MHGLTAVVFLASALRTIEATPITSRDVRGSLPVSAHEIEHKFQPLADFDTDGCYYTSAMDLSGNVNPGLPTPILKGPAADCRQPNRLENNNVYSRKRCNNGWCAIMYEYYFEKDQAVWGSYLGGHQHDWENVIIFAQGDSIKRVAPSCHGKYDTATNSFRADGTRAKVVYHKDGAGTHCFRIANEQDDNIENYTGQWFLGRLVGWDNWPSIDLRSKLLNNWAGGVGPKLTDAEDKFVNNLRAAAGSSVPGFDPTRDG